jgi:hypothetical protein
MPAGSLGVKAVEAGESLAKEMEHRRLAEAEKVSGMFLEFLHARASQQSESGQSGQVCWKGTPSL